MQVRVTLYTILRKYASGKVGPDGLLELHENATLQDLCDRLAIPPRMGRVFLVNGSPRREGWVLNPGDEVRVFAFIGGG